jgi:hypothetical protein
MVGGFFDGEEKAIALIADRIEFEIEHNVGVFRGDA